MKVSGGGLGTREYIWRELKEGATLQKKLGGRSHLAGLSEFSKVIISEKYQTTIPYTSLLRKQDTFVRKMEKGKELFI